MRQSHIRISIIHLALLLFFLTMQQRDTSGQSIAKYAGEFLSIGVGARAQALGGAFAAIADDGTAFYWNPAGIGQLLNPQISVMHAEQFAGEINYDFAGIVLPFRDKSTIGFSVIRLGIEGIPDTRNALIDSIELNGRIDEGERLNIDKITFFTNSDYAFYFTFAHKKGASTFLGANVKLIRRSIGDEGAWGIGFDAGFLTHIGERLTFGANLMDATTTILVWDTASKELISPTLKLGSGYKISSGRFPVSATPIIDADLRFENRRTASNYNVGSVSIDMHYGMEMKYQEYGSFRIGYDDIRRMSFGLGVKVRKMVIDYAFTSFNEIGELGNSHRVSLAYNFKSETFRRSN